MVPVPGRGSETSVLVAPTTGVRPPAGRRVWAGRRLGAARTGRDATRAATPHLSPAAFRVAPPGAGEEKLPKAGRAPPPGGRRRWMQVREKAPPLGSHYPDQSLIKHFLLGVLQKGKPEPGREALPSTVFDLPSLSASPETPNTP